MLDESSLSRAVEGTGSAFYLVHGMADPAGNFRQRDREAAERFAAAATRAGLERIVYLGGMAPSGASSEHLRSRVEVGEILRNGKTPALELRASMIIGHGSLSWLIVRDLAARLPFMILPRWLASRSEPIAVEDVLIGLVRALSIPGNRSQRFDLPGPERLSGREILERTAKILYARPPRVIELPLLTPWLSSQWLRFVTRADWSVARELVSGLSADLLASDGRFWGLAAHERLKPFASAARLALLEEEMEGRPSGAWAAIERRLASHARAY